MGNGNKYHDKLGRFTSKEKSVEKQIKKNEIQQSKKVELANKAKLLSNNENIEHIFDNDKIIYNSISSVNKNKYNEAIYDYIVKNNINDKRIFDILQKMSIDDQNITDDDAMYLFNNLPICKELEEQTNNCKDLKLSDKEIEKYADKYFNILTKEKPNAKKERIIYAPQGKAGSGKSSTLKMHDIDIDNIIELDNDNIKQMLNEYYKEYINDGDTVASAQNVAKQIEKKVFEKLKNEGYTFIYSKVHLKDDFIPTMEKAGYKVLSYETKITNASSYTRMLNRYLFNKEKGTFHRYIPFNIIMQEGREEEWNSKKRKY